MDGYPNVRTVHPCPAFAQFCSTDAIGGADDLDLVWLQTGHADRSSIPDSRRALDRELAADHGLPVINSEVCYEGIAAGSSATLPRFLFWLICCRRRRAHVRRAGLWAFRRAEDRGPGIMWGDAYVVGGRSVSGLGPARPGCRLPSRPRLGRDRCPPRTRCRCHAGRTVRALPYAARLGPELVAYFPAVSLPAGRPRDEPGAPRRWFLGLAPGRWRVTTGTRDMTT